MIKFYALALSSYCTKVRIVLRIKNIPFEESNPLGGHYTSEQHQRHMPPGTIPAIEDGKLKLFDSEAIIEYLEDRWPEPAMRAADLGQRARQRAIAQFHNTKLEPSVRALFPLVKQGVGSVDSDEIKSALGSFQLAASKLELVINPTPFIGGDSPCLADCGYPATLCMGQDLFSALGVEVEFGETIDQWRMALEAHPIIEQEVINNRKAVAEWTAQF